MNALKTDCRHFAGDRPCLPHKQHGVVCATCTEHYDPVATRILLVKLAAMGDVLRTTSLLPAVHRRWPGAHVTWVTDPASVPLLAGHPAIDRVLAFSGAAPVELLVEHFDVVLGPDAAADAAALVQLAKTNVRIGFGCDERGTCVPLTPGAEHWMELGLRDDEKRANRRTYPSLVADVLELDDRREPPSLHLGPDALQRGRELASLHRNDPHLLVGLNTGAGGRWRHKRWTEDGFTQLIEQLGGEGHRVLLLGGPDAEERNARLARASGGVALDTGGHNDVTTFAGIVDACDVVVTGDTLAMHLALARGVPAVVLFGPTSLHEIDVFDRGERLASDLPCLGCYLPDCDVSPHCMESIAVETVHAAVLRCGRLAATTS